MPNRNCKPSNKPKPPPIRTEPTDCDWKFLESSSDGGSDEESQEHITNSNDTIGDVTTEHDDSLEMDSEVDPDIEENNLRLNGKVSFRKKCTDKPMVKLAYGYQNYTSVQVR